MKIWKKITIAVVIICIIIVAHSQIKIINFLNNVEKKCIANIDFRTGDVIMFKTDPSFIWYGNGGLNISNPIGSFLDALQYYKHKNYTHVGIVMVINGEPHIWELAGALTFDKYTQQYIKCKPCLRKISDINLYEGFAFIYQYYGNIEKNELDVIKGMYKKNITFQRSILKGFWINVLKMDQNLHNNYLCVDFIEDIMFNLGIIKTTPTRNAGIDSVLKTIENDDRYDNNPVLLMNRHYIDDYQRYK